MMQTPTKELLAASRPGAGVAAGQETRVLVVEDEPEVARMLTDDLTREGFVVDSVADGVSGLETARRTKPDLVILDVGVPVLVGTEVCRILRSESDVPIIMLSAHATVADLVRGLELGADDYVTKPFSPLELVSRVRALLRRRELDRGPGREVLTVGTLRIDLARHEVTIDGVRVRVTPVELRILTLLAKRPGEVVTQRDILSELRADEYGGDQRSTYVHISNLRRKMREDEHEDLPQIVTVPGVGYRLDPV